MAELKIIFRIYNCHNSNNTLYNFFVLVYRHWLNRPHSINLISLMKLCSFSFTSFFLYLTPSVRHETALVTAGGGLGTISNLWTSCVMYLIRNNNRLIHYISPTSISEKITSCSSRFYNESMTVVYMNFPYTALF